jgi:hypothetical protein
MSLSQKILRMTSLTGFDATCKKCLASMHMYLLLLYVCFLCLKKNVAVCHIQSIQFKLKGEAWIR